jgi:serine/threonine protein kinase
MAMPTLAPGVILRGHYRVESLIGSGGYATVYKVLDLISHLTRAMKEVVDPDTAIREQFSLEAQLLMTSNHSNIPHGYDHFEENGRAYLVMDYIEGKDLEQLLTASLAQTGYPVDEAQALRWILPICEALEFMHTRVTPIIHRDIKPANIKLNAQGVPILIDFGLAKLARLGPTNQAAQGVTPGYAPPEQYLAQGKTDARSDIYGVGATLYTLVTGREPAEAPHRLLAEAGNTGQSLIPVKFLNHIISDGTVRLIECAMDISASQRQQSARELHKEIVQSLHFLEHGHRARVSKSPTGPVVAITTQTPVVARHVARSAQLAIATPTRAMPSTSHRLASTKPIAEQKPSPWINLGGDLVRRIGKISIVFSAVELYWGLLCTAALAGILGTKGFTSFPSTPVIIGAVIWVGIVITLTVLVVRAIDRPIARRGHLAPFRRWLQGILLVILWSAINGIALINLQSPTEMNILLTLGLLGLASILTGLLSIANTLA